MSHTGDVLSALDRIIALIEAAQRLVWLDEDLCDTACELQASLNVARGAAFRRRIQERWRDDDETT